MLVFIKFTDDKFYFSKIYILFEWWLYVNLELNGEVDKEFKIFSKQKRKVAMAGPVPIVITLGGEIALGFDFDTHFSWSAYANSNGSLEFGVEYLNNAWHRINNFNPPQPKFEIGQNIEEDADKSQL